jgi:hypothetical protein
MMSLQGRSGSFTDGIHGGDATGSGTYAATAQAPMGAKPSLFNSDSVLALPDRIANPNGMDPHTFNLAAPMAASMRSRMGYGSPGSSPINV